MKDFIKSYGGASSGDYSFDDEGQKYLVTSNISILVQLAAKSALSYDNQRLFFDLYNNDQGKYVLCNLIENPTLHKDIQMNAFGLEMYNYNLVKNKGLDPEVQDKLYNNADDYILKLLSSNPNLSLDLQKKILNHKSYKIRRCLAKNRRLSKEIWQVLAKDKSKLVVRALVRNKFIKGDDKIRVRVLSGLFN